MFKLFEQILMVVIPIYLWSVLEGNVIVATFVFSKHVLLENHRFPYYYIIASMLNDIMHGYLHYMY